MAENSGFKERKWILIFSCITKKAYQVNTPYLIIKKQKNATLSNSVFKNYNCLETGSHSPDGNGILLWRGSQQQI